ncbi:MAG: glycosyltransferase family 2 protein [Brumimicrobium sp.]
MKPIVSIIIPAKNEAKFISECIESVQNQSFLDFEVIVVDDNSTDSTFEILQDFSKKDHRIKVLKNNGNGIISALRLAFENTEGDYITRMDADDRMKPNKIQVLHKGLNSKGNGYLAVGGVEYFSENNELGTGFKRYEEWLNNLTASGENFKDIFKECVIPSPCWMISRMDLINVNAFDEERYPEDYDLAFRFYEAGYKVLPTKEIVHEWRDYPTRTSRTHENYADYTFTPIKMHYFLKLHYDREKKIVVFGASYRGKELAKYLSKHSIDFLWVGSNPNKIGKHIYDKLILSIDRVEDLYNKQFLITVANESHKNEINLFLSDQGLKELDDYFFFA